MLLNITRPETDLHAAKQFEQFAKSPEAHIMTTSIDLLEVREGAEEVINLRHDLRHMDIKKYLEKVEDTDSKPSLTVFFLKTRLSLKESKEGGKIGVHAHPDTLVALQHHYNIPPAFIELASQRAYSFSAPQQSFTRYHEDELCGVEGTYFYDTQVAETHPMVHFAYDLQTRSAVYFIAHAPPDLIEQLTRLDFKQLSTPFIVDLLLAEYAVMNIALYQFKFSKNQIVKQEKKFGILSATENSDIREIHSIARSLATSTSECEETINQIAFLLSIIDGFKQADALPKSTYAYITESLQAKQRRITNTLLWYKDYHKRIDILINLAFNLRTQRDSEINHKIGKDTAKIAHDAQRDNASMITIAAVTMFFLPGTFICAVFSMVFFNTGVNIATGENTFSVSPKLWYFFAVTVPLTVVVFAVWAGWKRQLWREKIERMKDIEEAFAEPKSSDQPELKKDQPRTPSLRPLGKLENNIPDLSNIAPVSMPTYLEQRNSMGSGMYRSHTNSSGITVSDATSSLDLEY